jgi:hypothetical protein
MNVVETIKCGECECGTFRVQGGHPPAFIQKKLPKGTGVAAPKK